MGMKSSESTEKLVDQEVHAILKRAMEKAEPMLEVNRSKIVQVAELLLKNETITSVDMEDICGLRKGRSPSRYSDIIRNVNKAKDLNE